MTPKNRPRIIRIKQSPPKTAIVATKPPERLVDPKSSVQKADAIIPKEKQEKPKGRTPKPPQPVVRTEPVQALCGHIVQFGHFADKTDKFRDRRREKVKERPCKECRVTVHLERQAKQQEAARELRKLKPKKTWRATAAVTLERLPHGSTFTDLVYDAHAVDINGKANPLWQGKLSVPTETAPQEFTDEACAVFRLLNRLDTQYRRWKAERDKPQQEEKKDAPNDTATT